MPKLTVNHNHKAKLTRASFLEKYVKTKLEIICQQWACKDTRSTKHSKHQFILMHAKRAHANKSRGITTYTRNERQIIVIQYLLDELMLTMNEYQA
jgi:hypothetical protein